jgi:hypothetical protein
VLLNNDARLLEGSLSAALNLYESENNCGLMGARVSHVSGGLQEAGCIIYQDGTTNGYLRYQPEDDLRALFQRDVDYCSGVFAIIARRHFELLGGLDEAYAPAYFEETDFCMRLREKGLRCIYNPRLMIDHFEFGSSAMAKAARQKIEVRRGIFLNRWTGVLKAQGYFAKEQTESIEAAALRLLPHPRRLVVLDARSALAEAPDFLPKSIGHVTFYVVNGNRSLLKRLVVKADMRVAFACGNRRQLRLFARSRVGFFGALEFAPSMMDADLIGDLRQILRVTGRGEKCQ